MQKSALLAELAVLAALQAILIALLGAGPTNGFGVFHAPQHDLYAPLILGGAIDLATFALLVFWALPRFSFDHDIRGLAIRMAALLAANVALQVATQSVLIALLERTPRGIGLTELVRENLFGAIATLFLAALYRFAADWVRRLGAERRMSRRIDDLEHEVAGLREDLSRDASGKGRVKLGTGKGARAFLLNEIVYLKAAGNYTEVNTATQTYTIYGALKALAEQLPADRFARIHRSFLVNLEHVRALNGSAAVLDGGKLPVGQLQRDAALATWSNFIRGAAQPCKR